MTTDIFFFSGTGNTLSVARGLAALLEGTTVRPIRDFHDEKNIESTADRIVIAFPVYIFGVPLIVQEFIGKLSVRGNAKVYALTTYGGMLARAILSFRSLCEGRGIHLSGGFGVKMPGNYFPMYDVSPEMTQQKVFRAADAALRAIAPVIREGKKAGFDRSLGPLGIFLTYVMRKRVEKQIRGSDRNFITDGKCNACGRCVRVCPVENIELVGSKVIMKGKCEMCFACFHWCPQQAIQYGKKTAARGRYHHPSIELKDITG
ncbi:MAG TPA: EFR1 family ferrodoxin [Spirochaetota bacterium]